GGPRAGRSEFVSRADPAMTRGRRGARVTTARTTRAAPGRRSDARKARDGHGAPASPTRPRAASPGTATPRAPTSRAMPRKPVAPGASYAQRLDRVLDYIGDRLDGELSLATLARVAGFSPFHFHRLFQAHVGETVHDHVKRMRVERAASSMRAAP